MIEKTTNKEIVEDLLKLIYAYQNALANLGIKGEQSSSVLRAEKWLSEQEDIHENKPQ